jgi:hypothetical protein
VGDWRGGRVGPALSTHFIAGAAVPKPRFRFQPPLIPMGVTCQGGFGEVAAEDQPAALVVLVGVRSQRCAQKRYASIRATFSLPPSSTGFRVPNQSMSLKCLGAMATNVLPERWRLLSGSHNCSAPIS